MAATSRIKIHDTTLRDGEQMPGVVFKPGEKIALAQKMVEFGVDLIDIMPVVSESEFSVTKELAHMFPVKVSATCRAKKSDVDTAIRAGAKRVTLFSPLSDLHITQKLGITREENIRRSLEIIDYAKSHGLVVDFAGEDASRANLDYLKEFLSAVHEKVASFFIADTVGCLTPESTRKLVWYVKNNCACPVGLHMHNDFGMATANTLEGLVAGAEIFSGTFTGIGERAGNAPIEEVSAALKYICGADIGVRHEMLNEICGMVQEFSGVKLQRHKPIVGENAFMHESGIHVDGILKNPRTYEFIEPEAVGQKRKICLGKHSGRKAVEHVLRERFSPDDFAPEDIELLLREVKTRYLANKNCSREEMLDIISQIKSRKEGVLA